MGLNAAARAATVATFFILSGHQMTLHCATPSAMYRNNISEEIKSNGKITPYNAADAFSQKKK